MANETVACGVSSCGGGGDEAGTPTPNCRVKFLCSYGGKILPRLTDGQLKYVGGETRVIGVPRDINFSALIKKLTSDIEGNMVLKYQLIPEDLDVLVSVRNDEDLKHMLEEYDRHENLGASKFRAFLFPSTPVILENQNTPTDPQALETRYIDAINNTFRPNPNPNPNPNPDLPSLTANRPTLTISTNSSPTGFSPERNTDPLPHEQPFKGGYQNSRLGMHRVHSSPTLYNLNSSHQQSNGLGSHHLYQQQHYHHHRRHQHRHYSSQPSRPPSSGGRAPVVPMSQYYSNVHSIGSLNAHNWNSFGYNMMGSGNVNRYGHYDESSGYGCRTTERFDSLPTSPRHRVLE